jgi:release factor glutamine methyltransferase
MASQRDKESWTLLELLNWTTQYFEEQGIENPRLNAELLLSDVMGMERVMLYARFEQEPTESDRRRLRQMVKARASRCPLQYVLGHTEFYGRRFEVNDSVLVPRPETELLVDKCLEKLSEGSVGWVVDIGTGSGVVAMTLACERPQLRVAATDSSESALEVARENARRNGVEDRVEFYAGHLCDPLPKDVVDGEGGIRLVASNPPYIPGEKIDDLQPEVSRWEPREALDGGADGLDVIREILPAGADVLQPGGWLVLEVGEDQADAVRELIEGGEPLEADSVETVRDDVCERVLAARKERA